MTQPKARLLTLKRALLATVGIAILAGILPAGIALDRRLANTLEQRARIDLSLAPRVLADRNSANADMMMMHAKDFAHVDGLAEALARNDHVGTLALVERSRATTENVPIVVGPDGKNWVGPPIDSAIIAQTRAGKMPVVVRQDGNAIQNVAMAPVMHEGKWVGAAGLLEQVGENAAGVLSGLTRSDVVILSATDGMVAGSTLDSSVTREIVAAMRNNTPMRAPLGSGSDILAGNRRRIAVTAPMGTAAMVVFSRSLADELAVLPELRRVALISAILAVFAALVLGAWLSARVARPVVQLAHAAQAITDGDFAAPLPQSRIREVERVSLTFDAMRKTLALRLADLHSANEALIDRNARLTALQADLMQRDRLTATGRLVAQLAHEIRNPVANLRNCLELIRRRVGDDAEAREFTDLAIDELLRMHELAEQMLDLNRPRDPHVSRCYPNVVAREVAKLSSLGQSENSIVVHSGIADDAAAALAPDALKQVLVNLVQNAREAINSMAMTTGDESAMDRVELSQPAAVEITISSFGFDIAIEVRDSGPGIPDAILNRIFDPFFTTKDAVHGVGLGLFVAEGLIRTAGGSLSAGNRDDGHSGAWFRIELPHAEIDQ